jgi:hypothetical protein
MMLLNKEEVKKKILESVKDQHETGSGLCTRLLMSEFYVILREMVDEGSLDVDLDWRFCLRKESK